MRTLDPYSVFLGNLRTGLKKDELRHFLRQTGCLRDDGGQSGGVNIMNEADRLEGCDIVWTWSMVCLCAHTI